MQIKILILNDDDDTIDCLLEGLQKEIEFESINVNQNFYNMINYVINNNTNNLTNIVKQLDLLGVPNDKVGYKYIAKAVLLWNEYLETDNGKITTIYKKIAKEYGKTEYSVEKAMRQCIEASFTNGNAEELSRLFLNDISIDTGKINNKKFISKIAKSLY